MEKSIGALWKKTSAKGNPFLSGNIEIDGKKYQIAVLKNGFKEKENQPDYHIHGGTEAGTKPVEKETEEISVADIPF